MRNELLELRSLMKENNIDVYIIPTGDYHGSEYINDFFKTREYISGFTGSAGTLVVTQDEARLWTDGRYFLQAAMELEGSGIDLMKDKEPGVPDIKDYIGEKLAAILAASEGCATSDTTSPVLGFDGLTLPCEAGREYAKLAYDLGGSVVTNFDLVGEIWSHRPTLQGKDIWEFPLSSAGLPFDAKASQVRELMADAGADYHLITTLDDNAWLYNLRGSDVERTPVFFSYTLITPEETILYVFDGSLPKELVPEGVTVKSYFTIAEDLAAIPSGSSIMADVKTASFSLIAAIPEDATLIETDFVPSARLKACKNPTEIEATIDAHVNDGIAMVNFIHWLKKAVSSGETVTEISAADYLEAERRKLPGFIDLSFDTIAGYADHGAIVHYGATPETDATLKPEGFILVDSGGQYLTGTTDITRTIALGPLTDRMKECYTAVLKGHIQLALATFMEGTTGKDLDPIAKAPLDEYGISYNHGTGHGVGHCLCVHEGPNRINTICEEPIIPGMITSDEPGYYAEGEFGVRIEGEIICLPDDDEPGSYRFNMLTCCPYEREAIKVNMLTLEELTFVNIYHNWVYSMLAPELEPEVAEWLETACMPL